MKNSYAPLVIITSLLFMESCMTGSNKTDSNHQSAAGVFDMQKARTFIDSVNSKFSEQFRQGDSAALASYYATDAKILLSNSEPITGNEILPAWGEMTHMGVKNFTFVTTDLTGDENFLIETGQYKMTDTRDTLVDRGNYVVIYKKENGVWKLYRDMGTTSLSAEETD